MDRPALIDSIKQHEGYARAPYRDSLGLWTVGHGHLIEYIPTYGGTEWLLVDTIGEVLNKFCDENLHEQWLHDDINEAITSAQIFAGDAWERLTDARQNVLVEMAFQLGRRGLLRFRKLQAAVRSGDFETAHDEMLSSKWHTQTPERCETLATRIL